MPTALTYVWADWRLKLAAAGGLAVGAALISAWLTPRGPVTASQALASMVAALVLGLAGGLVLRSRWSMLLLPAVFVGAFELARLGVAGPTVDRMHLTSTYGMIAFVLGRGLHGLLVLLPMILGARFGVELAARLGPAPATTLGVAGWGLLGGLTTALVALAITIALPARTAPIVDRAGQPLNGSIAELASIPIGGHSQALLIRGRSSASPVLLYLAGGPGGTDLGAMRADVGLEQHFVVATWDQRGAGKSYAALDPTATLTLDQMVADTIEVTNYLRKRFGQAKIYLVGNSWGTLLGVRAVQQHPELYHAYIGTGQMVSTTATDRMFWEDSLAWAERTGKAELAATLRANGPPPYDDLLAYEPAIAPEHAWNAYPELDTNKEMPFNLLVPENSLMDRANGLRGFLDTFAVLYPQLHAVDLRRDAPRLAVPVYIVLGRHEARGRAVLAQEWFAILEAPAKQLIIFEHSGHRPLFEEPAAFTALMAGIVDAAGPGD